MQAIVGHDWILASQKKESTVISFRHNGPKSSQKVTGISTIMYCLTIPNFPFYIE